MDEKQQAQLQFLGFVGILQQSIKIIFKNPKIFTQITLAFILPFPCISVVILELSKFFSTNYYSFSTSSSLTSINTHQPVTPNLYWTMIILFISIISSLISSLLSTSTVVYTVACIQTNQEITFKKVLSSIPKVSKRLIITILSISGVYFVYSFVVMFLTGIVTMAIIVTSMISDSSSNPTDTQSKLMISMIALVILLGIPISCMSILWILAKVIPVVENVSGFKAMKKSMVLTKGKRGTAVILALFLMIWSLPLLWFSQILVGKNTEVGVKIMCGIIMVVVSSLLLVYELVVETVFYFVCKSYHNREEILGGYVALKTEDISIERLQV